MKWKTYFDTLKPQSHHQQLQYIAHTPIPLLLAQIVFADQIGRPFIIINLPAIKTFQKIKRKWFISLLSHSIIRNCIKTSIDLHSIYLLRHQFCSQTFICKFQDSLQTIQGTRPGPAFHVSTAISSANATMAIRPFTTSAFCAAEDNIHSIHEPLASAFHHTQYTSR